MLEMMVTNKVKKPCACALMVNENGCSTFVLDLVHEAIYSYYELAEFELMTKIDNVDNYWKAVESLLHVKAILLEVKKDIISSISAVINGNAKDDKTKLMEWTRPSFDKPYKIEDAN
ncbi:hypothetical protein RMCBS344292_17457 [Rhizopus microsporus]|nr:hypothetical protein RMCBS344292_17457 [Rhizopus microsporus]